MQSVLIIWCFIYTVSLLCIALYAQCPYYSVLYSVLIIFSFSALYAHCYTQVAEEDAAEEGDEDDRTIAPEASFLATLRRLQAELSRLNTRFLR